MKTFALSAAFVFAGVAAQAATISLYRGTDILGTVGCGAAACEGWDGSAWSSTIAQLANVHPSSSNEENYVSAIAGIDFTGLSNKDETGAAPTGSLAAYVLFKLGGGNGGGNGNGGGGKGNGGNTDSTNGLSTALLRNISGGAISYTFTQVGTAAGLSHTNSFGTVAPVPVPASGVLLGGVLLAGGWAARRKRKS